MQIDVQDGKTRFTQPAIDEVHEFVRSNKHRDCSTCRHESNTLHEPPCCDCLSFGVIRCYWQPKEPPCP